jgi:2-polyprenyl-3-methyl-5-hydroxy-6-metoxy-1,4-benzoquinol methylase
MDGSMSSATTENRKPANPEYEYFNASLGVEHQYLIPSVNSSIGDSLHSGATILDLGCGNGAMLATFRDRGWKLYGTDFSESGIRNAGQAFPEITFVQADVGDPQKPLPQILENLAGNVDLVLSTEVIEHLYYPKQFLHLAFRMLKPGGKIILSTPYHGYLKNLALAATGEMDKHFTVMWDHGHIKFWSRKTLTEALANTGFLRIEFHGVGRIPYLWKSMVMSANKPA